KYTFYDWSSLWGNYIWNSSRVCLYGSLYDERCSPAKYCRNRKCNYFPWNNECHYFRLHCWDTSCLISSFIRVNYLTYISFCYLFNCFLSYRNNIIVHDNYNRICFRWAFVHQNSYINNCFKQLETAGSWCWNEFA